MIQDLSKLSREDKLAVSDELAVQWNITTEIRIL